MREGASLKIDKLLLILIPVILLLVAGFQFLRLDFTTAGEIGRNRSSRIHYPDRENLLNRWYSQRRALVVYGTGSVGSSATFQQVAEALQQRSRWMQYRVLPDTALAGTAGSTVFLIGSPKSNHHIATLMNHRDFPLHFNGGQLRLAGEIALASNDVITLFYPNPLDSAHAVYLITGSDDAVIARMLNQAPRLLLNRAGDYRIFRNGQTIAMGFFSQQPENLWQFDAAQHRDYLANAVTVDGAHYRFVLHGIDTTQLRMSALLQRHEKRLKQFCAFLNVPLPQRITYHLYNTFEDKGMATGNTDMTHFDEADSALYAVVNDAVRGDDFSADARLLLRRYFGQPKTMALEHGLSMYFSENWHRKGYAYWAARLWQAGIAPSLPELLDNRRFAGASPLVAEAVSGAFVAYLVNTMSITELVQRYRAWQPTAAEIADMESGWQRYMDNRCREMAAEIAADRREFPRFTGFQKGFCFAHEGYQIYNGYLSRKADEALEKLQTLGVNAVSITPFTFMRDATRPVPLRFSEGAGSENDESIMHAGLKAQSLGMQVMIKPHIWLGGNRWPGDIEMQSEADWQHFFEHYTRWISHYALMAEMYRFPVLCVGVEMVKTTAAQAQRWRDLIARLRKLYSGQITYAANWGSEIEQLSFGDALDFVGLNCYYPLSQNPHADTAELREGVEQIARVVRNVSRRFDRPVVITEIGFTSTPGSWVQPHETSGNKPVDLEAQARSYRAVFAGLYRREGLSGIYWWKWPTYLEYGGSRDNDFTPNNKPAEKIIAEWFRREWLVVMH
jgi:hypothetical protein